MSEGFLGRGWSFPPTFRAQGRSLDMVESEEDIRQSLQILLHALANAGCIQPLAGGARH